MIVHTHELRSRHRPPPTSAAGIRPARGGLRRQAGTALGRYRLRRAAGPAAMARSAGERGAYSTALNAGATIWSSRVSSSIAVSPERPVSRSCRRPLGAGRRSCCDRGSITPAWQLVPPGSSWSMTNATRSGSGCRCCTRFVGRPPVGSAGSRTDGGAGSRWLDDRRAADRGSGHASGANLAGNR